MSTSHTVVGTCHHDCPDSCGWVATAVDGVLTTLRGNPEHPYSAGELCPKVNRFVHRVNNPDRVLRPLIRTGPKGAGLFRETSWDDALALTAERLLSVRDEFGGEAIFPWHSAGTQGMIQESSLDRVVFAALGASVQTGSICGQAAAHGMAAAYGAPLGADPLQLEHAELVILWGTNTRLTNRHLWPTVEAARERGARVIVVDPVRTITADHADQHLAIRPGTDMALLLAMIHELVAEDLLDHAYIDAHSTGFDELAASVHGHDPEWAAPICGLDADTIRTFARAYGTAQPAFIRGLVGAEHQDWGGMVFRTLSALPVLTGSWRHRGGGFARSVGSWAEVSDVDMGVFDRHGYRPATPPRGLLQTQIGRTLTDDTMRPPVRALVVWNGNPLVSMPNAAATRRGLERDDLFTVVSEQFVTDTARYADVVFPATTQVEQLDVVPSWGHLWLGWNEPAVEPLGEAVPNTELWRRLGRALGVDDPLLTRTDEELIDHALGSHVDRGELRGTGWVRVTGTDDLMPYVEGGFHTPDGRARLAGDGFEAAGLPRVPRWQEPVEAASGSERHPLLLATPKKQTRFLNSTYSGTPGHGERERGPYLEMTATDAADRSLAEGDRATVHNDRGRLDLEVRITDRVGAGVVSVPWGWWSEHYASGGAVVNDLANDQETDQAGGAGFNVTRVQVSGPDQLQP